MINVLNIDYNEEKLTLDDKVQLVPKFYGDYDYILCNNLSKIDSNEHDVVLRNIDLVNGNVSRAINLHKLGLELRDYSIISSNCLSGFVNQFLCKPQGGPCGFWRYDPHKFYQQLLAMEASAFINSLLQPKLYTELNGHFFGEDETWKIAFNHMKKTTTDNVKAHFLKRTSRFKPNQYLIILCLDRLNFTKDEVLAIAKKKPNALFVTNYNIEMNNVFSYPNTDKQFYLKGMQFLNFCPDKDITRFRNFILKEVIK